MVEVILGNFIKTPMNIIKYSVISFTITFCLFNCSGSKNPIQSESMFLTNDTELLKNLDTYLDENYFNTDNKRIAIIYFSDKIDLKNSNYYISSIANLSHIYYYPFSSYFIYKGRPVLLYSKKDDFLNPDFYYEELINLLAENLHDDMLIKYIYKEGNSYEYEDAEFVLHHPQIWHITKNEINTIKGFSSIKSLIFDNWSINLIKYYRVKEGGRDDRNKN
jgi:hypothetical protein